MKISERSDILRFNKTVVVSHGMYGWWEKLWKIPMLLVPTMKYVGGVTSLGKGRKGLVKPIERLTAEM